MIPFLKMHGCGNDFVVLDARAKPLPVLDWVKLANRFFGIGCDQIVILEKSPRADVGMRIINADGSEVASCGNASRCVGALVGKEKSSTEISIDTLAGVITAYVKDAGVTVDMGEPRLEWRQIPLAREMDTLHLTLDYEELHDPVAVSMGNPHAVFFVNDADAVPLEQYGPVLERHTLFPERANISVAQILAPDSIRLRVWERGGGLTLACGTGACAALVAAHRRGLVARKAQVHLPGGSLSIQWRESDNHVLMTGPVVEVFKGSFEAGVFAA